MRKIPTLLDLYEAIKPKYTIFCDMDGVLVDFDKGYKDLTGVATHHANEQGKNEFWNLFNTSLEEKGIPEYQYWVNLGWQPGGQELWNFIKPYKPYILTAPTYNPESREGKREWVQRLDGMKNIYFRPAKSKSDFSGKNRILIDDRADTIDKWNAKEGIGILHTSAQSTIEKLKQLGL
jgi:5'(3')-deoxyribonucleotidase